MDFSLNCSPGEQKHFLIPVPDVYKRQVLKCTGRPVPQFQQIDGSRAIWQLHQGRGMPTGKFFSTIGLFHTLTDFFCGKVCQKVAENPLCALEIGAIS